MEENNQNFSYGETANMLSGNQNSGLINSFINGLFETGDGAREDNVFSRWLHPDIAEQKQFEKENYFVDKENAFNEYMYERSLKDNSAAAQMERAKEAGINPLLAAQGIMGAGNAVATPIAGASGTPAMNTNSESPFSMFSNLMSGLSNGVNGIQELGKVLGFGKENKATIKNIQENTKKIAEEAKFTYWQRRQFVRTMDVLSRQLEANYDQTIQNIENLKKLYDVYDQQKWNLAADTTLKEAQTGEVAEKTENIKYANAKEQWRKAFRDTFGIELNESDLSMLVQAVLNGKGKAVIDAITETAREVLNEMRINGRKGLQPIVKKGTKVYNDVKREVKQRKRNTESNIMYKKYEIEWYGMNPKTKQRLLAQGMDKSTWIFSQMYKHATKIN